MSIQEVLADKAYDIADNRNLLKSRNIKDRILPKAIRNKPITKRQKVNNILISKIKYKIEQCFGRLKRGFNFYFSTVKVQAQALLKSCCFNMLKAVSMMT
ncbi:transposase family protein [Francisella-like endosymbiont]|uniref:transposase family protein n=1 Tax=Francisella-like endosymbiont TaxID=512373 RepID=UPI00296F60CE